MLKIDPIKVPGLNSGQAKFQNVAVSVQNVVPTYKCMSKHPYLLVISSADLPFFAYHTDRWNECRVRDIGETDMAISKELLDILACPKCKGDIHLNEKEDGLICDSCRLLYEIKDDIPIMLIEEAKPLD